MNKPLKQIYFAIRSYNDLDTYMPLMAKLAKNEVHQITVLTYIQNGTLFDARTHDAFTLLNQTENLRFTDVIKEGCTPLWMRCVRSICMALPRVKGFNTLKNRICRHIYNKLDKDVKFHTNILKRWNPDIIFTDEVSAQISAPGFISALREFKFKRDPDLFLMLTGYHVYSVLNPSGATLPEHFKTQARAFFMPSEANKNHYVSLYPTEKFVVPGHLRMDRAWVKYLNTQAKIPAKLAKMNDKKLNVVMMLSKFSYGVKKPEILQTIEMLAKHPDVNLVIKPHTRGMGFEITNQLSAESQITLASEIGSSALIKWSDLVLFTGSSIAFQAMILGKAVGFLKYCQVLETLFDDGTSCDAYEEEAALKDHIRALITQKHSDAMSQSSSKETKAFLTQHVYAGDEEGNIAARYAQIITDD